MNLKNAYSNVIMWKYLRKLLRPSPPVDSIKRFNVAPSREAPPVVSWGSKMKASPLASLKIRNILITVFTQQISKYI